MLTHNQRSSRAYGYILLALALVFLARVIAQAVVAVFRIGFLPSMEEWTLTSASPFSTSGMIPYPVLLSLQIAILVFQAKACRDFLTGKGAFISLSERTGRAFRWIGILYFASMGVRYVVTMALRPEHRWLGHTVPIFIHCTIAAFLFTAGLFYRRRRAAESWLQHFLDAERRSRHADAA
jgi:hypothetical protein